MKALITNRIGDFFLLFGVLIIFDLFKSVDFYVVFCLTPYYSGVEFLHNPNIMYLNFITLFLFLGAVSKSAQVGLHI
jgi:NADH:ubiquinone oxidoreductase subunit 5 (subunit L)/multisubunit Na+/H+ antiporter MnhA subunit